MRISYTGPRGGPDDAKGDALWIVFREDLGDRYDESEDIAPGIHAHYDYEGNIISIEVYENASGKVNLSRIDMIGLSDKEENTSEGRMNRATRRFCATVEEIARQVERLRGEYGSREEPPTPQREPHGALLHGDDPTLAQRAEKALHVRRE